MFTEVDLKYMQSALSVSKKSLGLVWPKPAVGCVLVKNGIIISRGWTSRQQHAEAMAIYIAKKNNIDVTNSCAYVTLEPCSHYGENPPCADLLVKSGISRCVVACLDPFALVNGKGIEYLRNNNVDVEIGLCEQEAKLINAGFFSSIQNERPYTMLKIATTLDGKIALKNKKSKWITSEYSRLLVQSLRKEYDAVLVGVGTVVADNPSLNCRLPGMQHDNVKVIIDKNGIIDSAYKIIDQNNVWIITANYSHPSSKKVKIIWCDNFTTNNILRLLSQNGITSVMVEGGQKIFTSFIKDNNFDALIWFKANKIIGNDGIAAINDLNITDMTACKNLVLNKSINIDKDRVEFLYNKCL